MPAWLTWKAAGVFFKAYGLQIAILLAVLGGLWYVDHRGYKRAEEHYKAEQAKADLRQAELNLAMERKVNEVETQLRSIVAQFDQQLQRRLSSIDVTNRTIIQPTITREIQNAPRLSDPSAGITDGLLRELNRARSLSWPDGSCITNADGSATCRMPAARPVEGQVDSNASR